MIKILNKIKNKIKKENNKKIINNKREGEISDNDIIAPAYINLNNPKYLEIDNLYYAGLMIVNYYREQDDILLRTLIESNINMNISVFYEKQDPYKVIKDLTLSLIHI